MITLTITLPTLTKRIGAYSRETHDFPAFIVYEDGHEEYIGSRPTQHDASLLASDYIIGYYNDAHTPEVAAQLIMQEAITEGRHERLAGEMGGEWEREPSDCPDDCPDECPEHGHGELPLPIGWMRVIDPPPPTDPIVCACMTECASCRTVQPCYDDGEAWICIDRAECQARQRNGAGSAHVDAYQAYVAADDAWQAELDRLFGWRAGDVRYTKRGRTGPTLAPLYNEVRRAYSAWTAAKEADEANETWACPSCGGELPGDVRCTACATCVDCSPVENCPGLEFPCGKTATREYHTATGSDMETARSVTIWLCEACYAELCIEVGETVEPTPTNEGDTPPCTTCHTSDYPPSMMQTGMCYQCANAVLFGYHDRLDPGYVQLIQPIEPESCLACSGPHHIQACPEIGAALMCDAAETIAALVEA